MSLLRRLTLPRFHHECTEITGHEIGGHVIAVTEGYVTQIDYNAKNKNTKGVHRKAIGFKNA